MTDTPFIDHREIKRARALTPDTDSLQLVKGISPVTLLRATHDDADDRDFGYLVSADSKYVVARLVAGEECEYLGRECLDLASLVAFCDRVSRIGELEDAAMQAQAAYVALARAFKDAARHIINDTPLNKKERLAIARELHLLTQMDAECAADEAKAREENDRYHRDRIIGIKATAAKFGLKYTT